MIKSPMTKEQTSTPPPLWDSKRKKLRLFCLGFIQTIWVRYAQRVFRVPHWLGFKWDSKYGQYSHASIVDSSRHVSTLRRLCGASRMLVNQCINPTFGQRVRLRFSRRAHSTRTTAHLKNNWRWTTVCWLEILDEQPGIVFFVFVLGFRETCTTYIRIKTPRSSTAAVVAADKRFTPNNSLLANELRLFDTLRASKMRQRFPTLNVYALEHPHHDAWSAVLCGIAGVPVKAHVRQARRTITPVGLHTPN